MGHGMMPNPVPSLRGLDHRGYVPVQEAPEGRSCCSRLLADISRHAMAYTYEA